MTKYKKLSFNYGTLGQYHYIDKMGIDENLSNIILPISSNGSSTTYYCDGTGSAAGWCVMLSSGYSHNGDTCGIFYSFIHGGTSGDSDCSARIMYIPQ